MSEPEVSVVCSTYQRAERVQKLVAALEAQTLAPDRFEVVVVNNGSTDDTASVLDEFAANTRLHFRPVHLVENRGASGGRNAGWRAARAPVIAFTDDDCEPQPGWLEAGLDAMTASAAAIVVGKTSPNPAQAHNDGVFSRTQTVNEANGTLYFNTCNIFYRRSDLEALEGFDPRFRTKGGEDTDLGWRVEAKGGAAAFEPAALVYHDVAKGSFRAAFREAATWIDIPLVTAQHTARARPLLTHRLFWKPSHEYVLVAGLSIGLTAALRNAVPLVGVAPWLYYRLKKRPLYRKDKWRRFVYLPHAFAIDGIELVAMVRGSVRHRTLVL